MKSKKKNEKVIKEFFKDLKLFKKDLEELDKLLAKQENKKRGK